jgi:hypothetical protein
MLNSTIEIGPRPASQSVVMQTQEQGQVSVPLPASILAQDVYFIGNAVTMGCYDGPVEAPPTPDSVSSDYLPRTPLGERLLTLRRSYFAKGGLLLDTDQLDLEMRVRRGGVTDA